MAGTLTVFSKEIGDHLGSKRYIILFALILVLSIMSAYQGVDFIRNNPNAGFKAIFTSARYGFSFEYLMVFFGPIIGLALSFDAINKERTSGSLSTLLSQPIYRDSVINGKFLAGTAALSLLAISTTAIMCGVAVSFHRFWSNNGRHFKDNLVYFANGALLNLLAWFRSSIFNCNQKDIHVDANVHCYLAVLLCCNHYSGNAGS